ncbi:MAG: HD domain-containing protein [Patescibacteria group bacterium]
MFKIYTTKIQKAIKFAAKTHNQYQQQKRKGKEIPYITHPLTVGMILSLAKVSEDVVVAGILHDTIEDSIDEKKVTTKMIKERFGKEVLKLVLSVTEEDKSLSWEKRKAEALEHIKDFSHEAILVKSADVISNVSELIDDYERYGDDVFERFNSSKEEIVHSQLKVISALISRWPESPLARDLKFLASDLSRIERLEFMKNHPAPIIEYKDYNENMKLKCPICGWKGTPKTSDYVNTDSHFCLDVSCPVCDKMLLVANYPKV